MSKNSFSFSGKHIMGEEMTSSERGSEDSNIIFLRDMYYSKFRRHIGLLLESKQPRPQHTNKGRLDGRRAYRFPFSEGIFKTYQHIPKSDTTFIILVDGSGSMEGIGGEINQVKYTRLEIAKCICSAFGKAIHDVTKDEMKIEVLVKSAPCVSSKDSFIKGEFVTLTRVMSNAKDSYCKSFEKVLDVQTYSPVILTSDRTRYGNDSMGSATAEYAVLPALKPWVRKHVTTKNVVVLNLTDGETYCSVGDNDFQFRGLNSKEMAVKYLRGIPNSTLIIGKQRNHHLYSEVFGKNTIFATEGFENKMFSTLTNLVQSSYE